MTMMAIPTELVPKSELFSRGSMTVHESDFWGRLEYRVCAELAGLADRGLRRLWCDGFIPEQYILDDPSPRIVGHAWIGMGNDDQEPWEFSLLLDRSVESREAILWPTLLPPPDLTRWLSVDPIRKQLVVETGAAVVDASSAGRTCKT